jgi:hypothetical protein
MTKHQVKTAQGVVKFTSAELFAAFDYAATDLVSGGRSAVNSERQQAILLGALKNPEEAVALAEMVMRWRNRTPPPD